MNEKTVMTNSIATNIRRFRTIQRLNQVEAAKRAGISRNAFRSIESGSAQPRSSNLEKIAKALHVTVMDLVREVPQLNSVRFRSHKTMTAQQKAERSQIVANAARWLADFNELEDMLNVEHKDQISTLVRKGRDPTKMAATVRQWMGLNDIQPIRDLCETLEKSEIKIYLFRSPVEKVFGFSISANDGGPAIAVNVRDELSVERRIFTAAHELGHLVLHQQSYTGEEGPEIDLQEREANIFASYFLMPQTAFDDVWNETRGLHFADRVMKVKRTFLVSYMTVLMRLLGNDIVDPTIWSTFPRLFETRYGRKLFRKSEPFPASVEEFMYVGRETKKSEPESLTDSDFVEDQLDRLIRDALDLRLISVDRAAEILNISSSSMRDRMETWKLAR